MALVSDIPREAGAAGAPWNPAPRARNRRQIAIVALSILGHGLAILALLSTRAEPPQVFDPEPMTVAMVELPKPPPPPKPTPAPAAPSPAPPAPAPPPPPRIVARHAKTPPPSVRPLLAVEGPRSDSGAELSDGELAQATTAGSGGPGRQCDMARHLQTALRKDPEVQAAVARARAEGASGRAFRVWNGEWIRNSDQAGAGLAVVREAMMMEVLSTPAACRAEPMHGLVLISLSEAPGSARVVVGAGDWRWSDLLVARNLRR